MKYRVLKGCAWKDPKTGTPHEWPKGGEVADGDVPPEVIKVLLRQKAIEPTEEA